MSPKNVVKSFYDSDIAKDDNLMDHFHPDCQINWNSSRGFREMDFNGIKEVLNDIKKSYHSFKYRMSHLLEDGNMVTARFTIYATVIERPDEEDPIAHFISIWEVKDNKLFRGYEISLLADTSSNSLNSYREIKV